MADAQQFQSAMRELDQLLADAEQEQDPAASERIQQLASMLLQVHGCAIQRMLERIAAAPGGSAVLETCAADDVILPILVLHNLHPHSPEQRIEAALQKLAHHLSAYHARVELGSISADSVVTLRFHGAVHCGSTRQALQEKLQQAVYAAAPEATSVIIDGLAEPQRVAGLVPVDLSINGSVRAVAS